MTYDIFSYLHISIAFHPCLWPTVFHVAGSLVVPTGPSAQFGNRRIAHLWNASCVTTCLGILEIHRKSRNLKKSVHIMCLLISGLFPTSLFENSSMIAIVSLTQKKHLSVLQISSEKVGDKFGDFVRRVFDIFWCTAQFIQKHLSISWLMNWSSTWSLVRVCSSQVQKQRAGHVPKTRGDVQADSYPTVPTSPKKQAPHLEEVPFLELLVMRSPGEIWRRSGMNNSPRTSSCLS